MGTRWLMDRCASSASHFLDNLACLFLGGAHFKHIVSTVKETRDREQDGRGVISREEISVLGGRLCPRCGDILTWLTWSL